MVSDSRKNRNEMGISERTRVLVIGLDGATFDLIKPWASQGKLPNFRKILKNGVHAELISTVPDLTPPAWVSIFTGNNPGKHGIFDFFQIKNFNMKIINSRSRKSEAVWNILNRHGRATVLINVPITYPPEKVNGLMITGMLTPNMQSDFVYPEDLKGYLINKGYRIDCDEFLTLLQGNKDLLLEKLFDIAEIRARVSLDLMKKYKWEFFVVIFGLLDKLQHFFWKYFDHKLPLHGGDRERKYSDVILKGYKKIDGIIGEFLEKIDKNVTLIVISDHGFGPLYKDFYVNDWLQKLGFLNFKKSKNPFKFFLTKFDLTKQKIDFILRKFNLQMMSSLLPKKLKNTLPDLKFSMSDIDFQKTKAYCPTLSGQYNMLRITAKTNEEYEKLRNRLTKLFYTIKDPETGDEVVEKVYGKEEVYWGPFVNEAPDLIVKMKEGYAMQPAFAQRKFFGVARHGLSECSGTHRTKGIFLVVGSDVKRGKKLKSKVHVWDAVPTILHIMEVSVPSEMDGRVLKEIFKSKSARDVVFTHMRASAKEKEKHIYSEDEKKEVRKRLRALGYIG